MATWNRKNVIRNYFLLLLLGLLGPGCEWGFNEQDALRDAALYQSNGDHNTAIIELKKVIKHNTSNKQARLMLAKSYIKTGQGTSAEKELGFAKKLGVSMSDIADLWGEALLLQKEYQKIFQDTPLTLAKLPDQKAKLMLVHGYAYAALDNKTAAYELFKSVKDSGFLSIEANIALSRHAMSVRDTALALKLIDEAIAADGDNATAWLHKGQVYLAKQDMINATDAFEKVIELSNKQSVISQEFQARVYLTQLAISQKNIVLARQKVDLLVKTVPEHPLSLYLSALVDYQEKNYDSARVSLEKLLIQTPNDLHSKLLLGAIHYAQGSYEQANKHLSYFVDNVPTHVQARKLLGAVHIKLGQHQDALDTLKSIGKKSDDSQLLAMIGSAAILNNDPQQAEDYYRRAKKSNPENQLLKRELANIYLRRGSIDDAIKELESISGKGKSQANKVLVYAHIRKNDFNTARKLAKDMLEEDKLNPGNYSIAGIVELAAGERLAARNYFEQSQKLDAGHLPGLLSLARMDFEDGDLESAKSRYKKVLRIEDKNLNAMMGLSALAGRENNTDAALKWLMQAKEKNPAALAPRMVLSQYYLKTNQAVRAVALLSEVVKSTRNKLTVMPLLITAQLSSGQKNEALSTAKDLVKTAPKAPLAHLHMARVQQALGDVPGSEKSLQKALQLKRDFLPANIAMASLNVRQGKYSSALQIATRIKQKYPKRAVGFKLEGEIYFAQKQFTKAIKSLVQAHKIAPASVTVRKLALAYQQVGKKNDAAGVLEKWLNTNPQDNSARLALALHYEKSLQAVKARKHYHAILEKAPDNVAALNNIALSYLESDKAKAKQYAERAYKLKPDIAPIVDTLGWVVYKNGDNNRARDLLARAASESQNPSIHYHYAVVLNVTGSKEQARRVLNKLFSRNSLEFPEKILAKQLLDTITD